MRRESGATLGAALVVALTALIAGAPAVARPVSIVNGTRTAMVALQIKQAEALNWRPDLLDHHTLGIQKQIDFQVGPACLFDVQAMFEDGHRVNRQRINLCKSTTYLLTDF
jgi:hypothetical protein